MKTCKVTFNFPERIIYRAYKIDSDESLNSFIENLHVAAYRRNFFKFSDEKTVELFPYQKLISMEAVFLEKENE